MSRRWLDPFRGKSREFVAAVDEVCLMHSVHPCTAASLLAFRDTEDGQRLMAGLPLRPQFPTDNRTRAWTRSPRRKRRVDEMTLDWTEDE